MLSHLARLIPVVLILSAALPGQTLAHRFDGAPESNLGWSVDDAGDVNGDGVNDWIVGAPNGDVNGPLSGSAFVRSGADGSVIHAWHGANAGDKFGWSVCGAGDVNADGRDDVVIGAYRATGNQANSGVVYVYSGSDGSLLFTRLGDNVDSGFGFSVSPAGDMNGDGHADFIVGAPFDRLGGNFPQIGIVYIFSGATGFVLRLYIGENTNDQLGWSVDLAGDVNGDGLPDHVFGAHLHGANTGRVYVHSGILGTHNHLIRVHDGVNVNDRLGTSVSGAGDVDGDGYDDIVVGGAGANGGRGKVQVLSGLTGALLHEFLGTDPTDQLGHSVNTAGDLDGDGHADLIAGAVGHDGSRGLVRVWSGRTGFLMAELTGEAPGDEFGKSVAAAGPGRVLIGAPRTDPITFRDGTVYVYDLPAVQLTISQPTPTSMLVTNTDGHPGHEYFSVFTTHPGNANGGLGTGWLFGLHVSAGEVVAQFMAGAPFRGTLDGNGSSAWFLPPGSLSGVSGLTLYAVTITATPGLQTLTGVSPLVGYTFQ